MSRPTKLTQELVDEARKYLNEARDFGGVYLPTIEGLALKLGTHRETITNWESKGDNEEATDIEKQFFDIVKELRSSQAEKLVQFGLNGKYNAMIAKLILSKHGYIEEKKIEQDINANLDVTRSKIGGFLDDTDESEDSEDSGELIEEDNE